MKQADPNAILSTNEPVRLQRALAAAGIGSRRACEELITEGRVEVDRQVVTELGTKVDPQKQEIRVDGERITVSRRKYYAVNKPAGVVSTNKDQAGRTRVIDLVETDVRLFPVGRLDRSSQGLILVTNDGDIAYRLTHPRFEIEKTYLVEVAGHPRWEELQPLLEGVHLAEGFAKVADLKIKKRQKQTTQLQVILKEGRNREIRRLLARIGHKVLHLQRIAMGPILLGNLAEGDSRQLSVEEVAQLESAMEKAARSSSTPGKKTSNAGHVSRKELRASREAHYQESLAARKKRKKSGSRAAAGKGGSTGKPSGKASGGKASTGKPSGVGKFKGPRKGATRKGATRKAAASKRRRPGK